MRSARFAPSPWTLGLLGAIALASGCYFTGTGNGAVGDTSHDGGPSTGTGTCVDGPMAARRVWTLSRGEYDTSVKAVLGNGSNIAASTFPPESRASSGFSKNPEAEVVDSNLVSLMMTAAETIASASLKTELSFISGTLSCTLAANPSASTPDPCAVSYIESRAASFFRRPITQEESDDLYATYLAGVANPYDSTSATSSGIELVVATLLQMPQFFYRTELGAPNDTSSPTLLTQYEIASEISFLATGGPPDDTLLAAAKAGSLTGGEIASQYQRLLATPAGHVQMQQFVLEWLGEDQVGNKGSTSGPVTPAIAADMQAESANFVEEAVFHGAGTVQELLTGDYTFANTELATFYGLPATGLTSNMSKVSLGGSERGGLLSQGAFLVSNSSSGVPLLHRGRVIRNKVLCETLPSFASLGLPGFTPPPFVTPPTGTTTRQALTNAIVGPCYTCHQYFQPIGYALEGFDPWGRTQTTQNGGAIDPSGQIVESTSVDPDTGLILDPANYTEVSFADYQGLTAALAAQPRASACFASQVVSYAAGRTTPLDDCATSAVQTGGTVQQEFMSYVQSKAFVWRTR